MGEDDVDTNVFEEWVVQVLELSRGAAKNVSNGTTQHTDKQGRFHTLSNKITVDKFSAASQIFGTFVRRNLVR